MSKFLIASYYTIQDMASGGKRRVNELARALQEDVLLVQPAPTHPSFFCSPFPADFGRRKRGINWGIFNLYWPANRRAARRTVAQYPPQVIIETSIWCHDAFSGCRVPRVLDAQNVDGRTMEERFGRRHYFTRLVRAQERRTVQEVAHVFCCSDIDAEFFCRDYALPDHRVTVAPNGVHLERSPIDDPETAKVRRELDGRCILFFMGKLDYTPNIEALNFIARTVLPELERRMPGRFVCLVSGGPRWPGCAMHPGLRYLGQVPHVAPWIALADICLAPVFSGSGTRLKILEYLAGGKPVVATAKAAEGLALVHGGEVLLAERQCFADAVFQLENNPGAARDMGGRGRLLVQSRYTWEQTSKIWRDGLARIIRAETSPGDLRA